MATLRGKVTRVSFASGQFYILNVDIREAVPAVHDYSTTVRGHICGLVQVTVGTTLTLQGEWTRHPKYGKQFNVNAWTPWAPKGEDAARFLHECVDGFMDYGLVRRIVDHFEADTFDALSNKPDAVLALATPDEEMPLAGSGAIKESTMRRALLAWERLRTVYELSGLLQDQGITSAAIQAVFTRFGSEARNVIAKNPYRLLELKEFQFGQVDRIAAKMEVDRSDPRRTQGAVLATLRSAALDGHVYVRRGELGLLFGDLAFEAKVPAFDTRPSRVEAAVQALADDGAIKVDPEAGVYLPDLYRYERESARMLAEFLTPVKLDVDPVTFLLDYQRSNRIDLSDAQREGVEKLLTSRVLVLTGLPGTGKCVKADTLVSGPWGFRPIGDFLPTDLRPDECRELGGVTIDTSSGPRLAAYVYNGGTTSTVRVRTSCGFVLEGTPEHPIRIARDGALAWATLGTIQPGDSVVLVRGPEINSFGCLDPLPSPTRGDSRERQVPVPTKMTPALAMILGYLTSEGSVVDSNTWVISAHDEKVIAFLEQAFQDTFAFDVARHHDARVGGPVGVRVHSTAIIRWLRSLGVAPEYAGQKSMPWSIMRSSREMVATYLRALFEGDGSVDPVRCTIEYGTASERLSYELQTILLAFGIVASRYECVRGGKPYFRVAVFGEDYDAFRDRIGFHLTPLPARTCASNTNKHVVHGVSGLVRTLMGEVRPSKGVDYNRFYRYGLDDGPHARRPSRAKIRQLLAYAGQTATTRALEAMADPRWFYDSIESVTQGSAQVVDFGVPDGHEFLSAGFVSHNTTVVRTIVNLLKEAGLSHRLMAPTGIASKRLASVTSTEAATIHRTFGYDGENWAYNGANKFTVDAVIVDEMSMVDMELFYRILDALHPSTMLVLVGDDAQLPSVGPGNVLRELIACPVVPNVRLTQIFRQAEKGGIVTNSHRINRGETLLLDEKDPTSEFRFVHIEDEEKIASLIVEMSTKLKSRDANFQVLAPKYDGVVGVDNLNDLLRERLNPAGGQTEWKTEKMHLREGDRVMVVQNDYKKSIYNGDMAKVMSFNRDEIVIKVHGLGVSDVDVIVPVPKNEAKGKMKLAYAITVHKCVDPDTLVEVPEGLVPAGGLPEEGIVATPTGRAPYRGFVRNPVAPMLEIETTDGYRLRVTPDHLVDRWGEGYEATRADALKEGDFLRLRLGPEFPGDALARLPEPPQDIDVRARIHKVPREVCGDVAEFLGMCVADVTVYAKGFRLAKRHLDYADRFAELCRVLFGVEPKRFIANNAHHVEVSSTLLSRWLLSIGGLAPNDKRVPPAILTSPVPIQARFLRGLFEDGTVNIRRDGTLDHIELFSSSEDVVRRVKVMLLRMSIISGAIRKDGGTSVCIYGQNARRFASTVGFISAFKTERLNAPVGEETRYLVPVLKSEVREVVDKNGGWAFMTYADKNALTRGTMSRHQLSSFLERAKERPPSWGTLHDRLAFHHSRVRSIRSYEGASVCVEVPDGHQFMQDGFCAWNSQGSEWETVILPITRTQGRMLQRNLFYTAVTRAKSKVWLLGHPDAVLKAIGNDLVVQRNTAFGRAVETAFERTVGGVSSDDTDGRGTEEPGADGADTDAGVGTDTDAGAT